MAKYNILQILVMFQAKIQVHLNQYLNLDIVKSKFPCQPVNSCMASLKMQDPKHAKMLLAVVCC